MCHMPPELREEGCNGGRGASHGLCSFDVTENAGAAHGMSLHPKMERWIPTAQGTEDRMVHMWLHKREDYDAAINVLEEGRAWVYHSFTSTETTQVGHGSEVCTQTRLSVVRSVTQMRERHGTCPCTVSQGARKRGGALLDKCYVLVALFFVCVEFVLWICLCHTAAGNVVPNVQECCDWECARSFSGLSL